MDETGTGSSPARCKIEASRTFAFRVSAEAESEYSPGLVRGKVVHAVRVYGEPSQTFVRDAILEVERLGWESWVLTRRVTHRDWYPDPADERILIGARPPLAERLGGRVRLSSPEERRSRWLYPRVRDLGPALVHAHFGWMACDVLPVARRLGVPLVVSFHGSDVSAFPRTRSGRRGYRELARGADRLTAVSSRQAAELRNLGFEQPIEIVPAGVRLAEFPFREPQPDAAVARLLFVGRQTPVKGLDVLLRAVDHVRREHPYVRLDVIGDGPNRMSHERLVRSAGLEGTVRFLGVQPRHAVAAALREADLLVVPSRATEDGQREGSPVLVKEALAVGVPVVATRSGGIPGTIPPEHRGELVDEDDPDALARAILVRLSDRSDWDRRARTGRCWVEREFDWRGLARRLDGVYASALDERRRSPARR